MSQGRESERAIIIKDNRKTKRKILLPRVNGKNACDVWS
jgi:hypothetical protein